MSKPKETCLMCARFVLDGDKGACEYDPIERKGVCGRCNVAWAPKQDTLAVEA